MSEEKVYQQNVTQLIFYRQYNTYQALLDVIPKTDMSMDDCFSKVVLHIMNWFKNRIEKIDSKAMDTHHELQFLSTEYPDIEAYKDFDVSKTTDINYLSCLDVKTAYVEDKKAWVFRLNEADNGKEEKDIRGRSFTTRVAVYMKDDAVVLGIRLSCKEPSTVTEDAASFRPSFVRSIFWDEELLITEEGLSREYAFDMKPIQVNGKSSEECKKVYNELINSTNRQMPILFVPGAFYESEAGGESLDKKTEGMLGYCHVVVWNNSCNKLFAVCMQNQELVDVANEGQLIFYRNTPGREGDFPSEYFEADTENVLDEIKQLSLREPLRKKFNYKEYYFSALWWRTEKEYNQVANIDVTKSDLVKELRTEIDYLNSKISDYERDNDSLQSKLTELKADNAKLEKDRNAAVAEMNQANRALEKVMDVNKQLEHTYKKLSAANMTLEKMVGGSAEVEKEKYAPLLHFPRLEKSAKDEIIDWIEEYYGDVLIIHPNAKQTFKKDDHNLDWRRFCMMIHYIAGYTKHRNAGGKTIDDNAARDYDPDNAAYTVKPVDTGACGSSRAMFADKYTINISAYNAQKGDVTMDLHLGYGKGRDDNAIRIYLYYDDDIKKSIIGYMPGHLPTRSDPH